jgi:hypothetical protein
MLNVQHYVRCSICWIRADTSLLAVFLPVLLDLFELSVVFVEL